MSDFAQLLKIYDIPVVRTPRSSDDNWNSIFCTGEQGVNFSRGGSIYTYYSEQAASGVSEPHVHNFLEMKIFLDAHNLVENVDGRDIAIKGNEILFVNQNEVHYSRIFNGFFKRIMLGFSPSFIDDSIPDVGSDEYYLHFNFLEFFFRRDQYFSGYLRLPANGFERVLLQCLQIIHASNIQDNDRDVLLKNHVHSMLSCLLAEYRLRVPPMEGGTRRMAMILFHVQNNFTRDLTIKELAQKFHISKSRLYELFKEQVGMPLSAYINILRLQKAKNLLLSTRQPVIQIASDAGFNDISYFNRLFKRKYGASPLRFRDNRSTVQ